MSNGGNREFIGDFIQESTELVEELEFEIVTIAKNVEDGTAIDFEKINKMFRAFHSIKGVAGFLEFEFIKNVAHYAENLLDLIRGKKLKLIKEHIQLFIKGIDFLKESIALVQKEESDEALMNKAAALIKIFNDAANPPQKIEKKKEETILDTLIDSLKKEINLIFKKLEEWKIIPDDENHKNSIGESLLSFRTSVGKNRFTDLEKLIYYMEQVLKNKKGDVKQIIDVFTPLLRITEETLTQIKKDGFDRVPQIDLYLELLSEFISDKNAIGSVPKLGDILVAEGVISEEKLEKALEIQSRPIGKVLVDMGEVPPEKVEQALEKQKKKKEEIPESVDSSKNIQRQDIRVDINKLDLLSNLMGELVIANNMLAHNPGLMGQNLQKFNKDRNTLLKIIRDLQEVVMSIRMIPIDGLFKKTLRLIHNLTTQSGKKVDIKLFGENTEIDKTVIELIADPMVHMIRNSLDHGLESPEERLQNGKNEKGTLEISAKHEEGEIWITIKDDGRGIRRDKVLKKAIEKGLIKEGKQLSDKEIFSLILEPGFSTADKITDISGRGVGMDVVKRNLDQINGHIDISSEEGVGTTIALRIPLTLAIIEGIFVEIGESSFMIPILFIKEFFKPKESLITLLPDGREMVKLRNDVIPIIRLHKFYQIEAKKKKFSDGILIVVESQRRSMALFVDSITGQQQAVIKALPEAMSHAKGISGCTILGNGDISMIVDVERIVYSVKS